MYCAICADPIVGEGVLEPLGRDDALVRVCDRCATEKPVEKVYARQAYTTPEQSASSARRVLLAGDRNAPRPFRRKKVKR